MLERRGQVRPLQQRALNRWLLLLYPAALIIGFALRYWLWRDQARTGVILRGDPDEYYRGAVHLWLNGSYYDEGQWLRPPLTSLFFALVFWCFGPNLPLALLLQCLLSTATALVIGRTARRIWQSEHVGLVSTWCAALYLPFAVYAGQLLSETIFILMIALAFWLFERLRRQSMQNGWLLLAGGIVFGAAILARPVGLYATPLLGIWAYLELREWRAAVRATALLSLGCALVIAPWSVRNYFVYHQVVLVDTNGGVSFWFGTLNDPADKHMQDVWNTTLPNSALRQQAALRLGFENIRKDPWSYVSHMRNKTVALWQLDTRRFVSNAVTGVTTPESSLLFNVISDGEYICVMLLAILALVLTYPDERNRALLLWPLYGTLLSALTLGHQRLRLPLMVAPLIYAAFPLAHPGLVARRFRYLSRPRYMALAVSMLAFGLLIASTVYIPFIAAELRALGGGEAALRAAEGRDPNNFLFPLRLGNILASHGDSAAASTAYTRSAALNARNVEAQVALLQLARAQGDTRAMEQARLTLDAIGFDNNLTYHWAWQHTPYALGPGLSIGTPAAIGAIDGFSRIFTQDGTMWRYTTLPQAFIRLQPQGETNVLLRVRTSRHPVPLQLFVNGREAWSGIVSIWQTITVPSSTTGPNPVIIELRSPVAVASPVDPYPYGVAVEIMTPR